MDCRRRKTARRASLMVEAVIAVTLLSTAIVALGKLAQSTARLQIQSDQRLTAALAADNLFERLREIPTPSIDESAKELAAQWLAKTGCKLEVETEPFTVRGRDGVHVTVISRPSDGRPVTLHDWYLASPSEDPSDEAKEDDDA